MTEPPRPGPHGTPHRRPPRSSRNLGIVVALAFLTGFAVLHLQFPELQGDSGLLLTVPLLGFLIAAIVLALIPRTSSLGGGLLIGMGIFLVVGAGLCVAIYTAVSAA